LHTGPSGFSAGGTYTPFAANTLNKYETPMAGIGSGRCILTLPLLASASNVLSTTPRAREHNTCLSDASNVLPFITNAGSSKRSPEAEFVSEDPDREVGTVAIASIDTHFPLGSKRSHNTRSSPIDLYAPVASIDTFVGHVPGRLGP
jgi:hypothetical protein